MKHFKLWRESGKEWLNPDIKEGDLVKRGNQIGLLIGDGGANQPHLKGTYYVAWKDSNKGKWDQAISQIVQSIQSGQYNPNQFMQTLGLNVGGIDATMVEKAGDLEATVKSGNSQAIESLTGAKLSGGNTGSGGSGSGANASSKLYQLTQNSDGSMLFTPVNAGK